MNPAEPEDRVLEFCKDRVDRLGGSVDQSPYKEELFDIFRAAFSQGRCGTVCGDSIRRHAREDGWITGDESPDDERNRVLSKACDWWDEWSYAVKQFGVRGG